MILSVTYDSNIREYQEMVVEKIHVADDQGFENTCSNKYCVELYPRIRQTLDPEYDET